MRATDRTVAFALRVFGGIDLTSLVTAAMPFAWMQALNERLGFGALPDAPTVEYLARHTSLWYAVHAAVWLYLSTDVPRYRPAVGFVAWLGLAFVAALAAVNLSSGMPTWWTLAQTAGGSLGSVTVLVLLRASRPRPSAAEPPK